MTIAIISSLASISFYISLGAIAGILTLSILAFVKDDFQFFPPPSKNSWQHATFLSMFRLFVYPLIVLTLLTFRFDSGTYHFARYILGGVMFLAGFSVAFWITFKMGWDNAFGDAVSLKTTGWFRFSRNPVYVATWVGLVGWTLITTDMRVTILIVLWAIMYLLAPFIEEPWLEQQYGAKYSAYKQSTPRFFWRF
jgi:protein-S-isoprenylcysteine O-methyltransferase Ste14